MNSEKNDKIETLDNIQSGSVKSNDTENNKVVENTNSPSNPVTQQGPQLEIKETATVKSEVGTAVIGEINGETITATNNPLPDKIDITVKVKAPTKVNNKKIKVVTKREKIANVVVIILVLLVLCGGGFAAYYFAYLNNPSLYTVKNLSFELGDTLPTSITYYITSPKDIDGLEYKLDVSNVKSEIGTYSYSVSHKSVKKTGTITINDTKGPVITFKDDLSFSKGSIISKEDLVASCDDVSNCTYKLEKDVDTSGSGEISVNVIANDDIGNTTTSSVNVNIVDISKTITCTSADEVSSDNEYKTSIEDTINFDSNNKLVSISSKKVVSYINLNSFFTLYNTEKDNSEYTFDMVKFNYSIKNDTDLGTLKTYSEISDYYSQKGYTCK